MILAKNEAYVTIKLNL